MDISQTYIDLIRAAHLFFFAAGMGPAIYFDFRSFRTLRMPITEADIADLERLHVWICSALFGLWVTGIALIYVRTAFDLSAFTPKLWLKIGIMVFMIMVSCVVGGFILPVMRKTLNRPLVGMSNVKLSGITQVAITSMFCWTSGLALGSGVVLKTGSWDLLLPLALGWFCLLTLIGQIPVILVRNSMLKSIVHTNRTESS